MRDDAGGEHEVVEATAEHPFWLEGRGWVGAGSLRAGERVLRADGRWLRVERVEARNGLRTVYNLEVEGWHTYVVGELGAWVHNGGPCDEAVKVTRALTQGDLGLEGTDAIVEGTLTIAKSGGNTVATAYVKYRGSPSEKLGVRALGVMKALKDVARSEGATRLRIETSRVYERTGRLKEILEAMKFGLRGNGTMYKDVGL